MDKLKNQVMELLKIISPSGKEDGVRNYLIPKLRSLCDKIWVDDYGNLLAEKIVGDGRGATILFSAHMDSVNRYRAERKIIEKHGMIYCSDGILGADDKSGIAIILAILRNLHKTSFKGKIKVAFTVKEEVGCKGAERINWKWLRDVDLAIVVDRRGNKDIVVGCGFAYCSDSVADFIEMCSDHLGMDWEALEGGISDAMVYAEMGINSVNLSAGYYNEHTEDEYLVVKDMYKTFELVLEILSNVNAYVDYFEPVGDYNSRLFTNFYDEGIDELLMGLYFFGKERRPERYGQGDSVSIGTI